jgi:hypothetical protein
MTFPFFLAFFRQSGWRVAALELQSLLSGLRLYFSAARASFDLSSKDGLAGTT